MRGWARCERMNYRLANWFPWGRLGACCLGVVFPTLHLRSSVNHAGSGNSLVWVEQAKERFTGFASREVSGRLSYEAEADLSTVRATALLANITKDLIDA